MEFKNVPIKIVNVTQNKISFMLEASCGKIVLRKKQFMEGVKWGRYLITNPEVLEMQGGMSLK